MEVDYKKITNDYVLNKQKTFEKVIQAAADIESFKSISFHNYNLDPDRLKPFAIENVLYFFKITNNQEGLSLLVCKEIQKLKDNPETKIKLPKVNLNNVQLSFEDNKILYVGKSSGNFSTRLKQHFGNESKKTYALHLNKWANNEILSKVKLELYYTSIDLLKYDLKDKEEKLEFIEQLESALHLHLKPILGRTGH
jgi:hypothetical protein